MDYYVRQKIYSYINPDYIDLLPVEIGLEYLKYKQVDLVQLFVKNRQLGRVKTNAKDFMCKIPDSFMKDEWYNCDGCDIILHENQLNPRNKCMCATHSHYCNSAVCDNCLSHPKMIKQAETIRCLCGKVRRCYYCHGRCIEKNHEQCVIICSSCKLLSSEEDQAKFDKLIQS